MNTIKFKSFNNHHDHKLTINSNLHLSKSIIEKVILKTKLTIYSINNNFKCFSTKLIMNTFDKLFYFICCMFTFNTCYSKVINHFRKYTLIKMFRSYIISNHNTWVKATYIIMNISIFTFNAFKFIRSILTMKSSSC